MIPLVPHNHQKAGKRQAAVNHHIRKNFRNAGGKFTCQERNSTSNWKQSQPYLRNMLFAHGVINSWGLSVYSPGLYSSLEARLVSTGFFWSDTDASKTSFVRSLRLPFASAAFWKKACPFHLSSQAPSRTRTGRSRALGGSLNELASGDGVNSLWVSKLRNQIVSTLKVPIVYRGIWTKD